MNKNSKTSPTPSNSAQSPLERMTELTRRVIQVPKAAIVKPKKALRKHR
jgi:hypothetical protein